MVNNNIKNVCRGIGVAILANSINIAVNIPMFFERYYEVGIGLVVVFLVNQLRIRNNEEFSHRWAGKCYVLAFLVTYILLIILVSEVILEVCISKSSLLPL